MGRSGYRILITLMAVVAAFSLVAACVIVVLLPWRSLIAEKLPTPIAVISTPIVLTASATPTVIVATPVVIDRVTPTPLAAEPTPTPLPGTRVIVLGDPTPEDIAQALQSAHTGDQVEIHYSEENLDRQVREYLAAHPNPQYEHGRLRLRNGRLVIAGRTKMTSGFLAGLTMDTELTVRLYAADCRPQLKVEAVSLSGLPAPDFAVAEADKMAQQWLAIYPSDPALCTDSIEIVGNEAVFIGHMVRG
jgi:hypothetical protein